ncbi:MULTISPECIES: hypothetical protein [unclassified Aeromicrobium]|jgi:hypothetical protein|uniref:hypothetical protein n=1 Tax=unclassified Aeromicrobium TaxID=2633570 RepID=UPI00257DAB20|nr:MULTISPECIES: hypothetical protein [unclassified Aeromicrobium]
MSLRPSTPPEQDDELAPLLAIFDAQKRLTQAAEDLAAALDTCDMSREQWDRATWGASRDAARPFYTNYRPRPSRPHEFEPQPLRLIYGEGGGDQSA